MTVLWESGRCLTRQIWRPVHAKKYEAELAVVIVEAPTEKDAMKILLGWQSLVDTEMMVSVPWEEAIKLL